MRTLRALASSWKTTAVAILVFLGVLFKVVIAVLDDDPATIGDFNMVVDAGLALLIALGFLSAALGLQASPGQVGEALAVEFRWVPGRKDRL